MGYQDIFYQNEEQYHESNQQHFKDFVESFTKDFGIDITKMARKKIYQRMIIVNNFFF